MNIKLDWDRSSKRKSLQSYLFIPVVALTASLGMVALLDAFVPAEANPIPSRRYRYNYGRRSKYPTLYAPSNYYPPVYNYPPAYAYPPVYGNSVSVTSGGVSISVTKYPTYRYPYSGYRNRTVVVYPPVYPTGYSGGSYPYPGAVYAPVYPGAVYAPVYPGTVIQGGPSINLNQQGNVVGPGSESSGAAVRAPFGVQVGR